MTARTTLDFTGTDRRARESFDFDLQPGDALTTYIADHLPNAKARKALQSELDDNEHAITRWMEGA